MKTVLIATLATITIAGGLNAQQSGHCQAARDSTGQMRSGEMMGMMQGNMMHGGMMQGDMMSMMPASGAAMRAMLFAPKHVKALGDSLNLTAEQVAGLDQLVEQSAAARRDLMAAGKAAAEKLAELFDAGTVDSGAVRATALDAFQPQVAMHAQMLVDAVAVRRILTASQRDMVADMAIRSRSVGRCASGTS
ncbi:MAG: periplasmic heavy metal sensor [Gemmatimonadetes bacterium]|nr:periplasmic heavy metal sensor [Gemmatimonadota bacterium]